MHFKKLQFNPKIIIIIIIIINSGLQRDSKYQQRKETSDGDPLSTHIYPGDFTKRAIVSSYDLDLQLYATLNDIRNNGHARHVAMHEKQ